MLNNSQPLYMLVNSFMVHVSLLCAFNSLFKQNQPNNYYMNLKA